jgi:exopolyphosphatase
MLRSCVTAFFTSLPLSHLLRSYHITTSAAAALTVTNLNSKREPSSSFRVQGESQQDILRSCKSFAMTRNSNDQLQSVGDFLKDVKQITNEAPQHPLHFILGNPAGDADSIISAICLAYIESMYDNPTTTNRSSSSSSPKIIPVVSIPIQDLKTQRPETMFLLESCANIDIDDLVAIDQLDTFIGQSKMSDRCSIHSETDKASSSSLSSSSSVTLVDHNRHVYSDVDLRNKNEILMSRWDVTEIIDHHLDENSHVDTCSSNNGCRIIAFDETTQKATVASTCTLVAERLMDRIAVTTATRNDENKYLYAVPPSLSVLLLGVILIDSVNMIPAAGKGTPRDQAAIDFLLSNTDWSALEPPVPQDIVVSLSSSSDDDDACCCSLRPDPTKFFETLQSQKFSRAFWNSLSALQGLRLDYKSFQIEKTAANDNGCSSVGLYSSFGVSTILLDMETFWTKDDLIPAFSKYLTDNNLLLLGLMFTFMKEEGHDAIPQRQLALISHDEDLLNRLVSFLTLEGTVACEALKLDSNTLIRTIYKSEDYNNISSNLYIVQVNQGNASASRKQVAPILLEFWQSEAKY